MVSWATNAQALDLNVREKLVDEALATKEARHAKHEQTRVAFADAKAKPSGKQTFGLLRRRHIRVERIIYIGRKSNRLEEMEAGIIHSPEIVYTEHPDPSRDEWQTKPLPVLKKIPIPALMRVSGRSRSMLTRTLAGRSRPRRRNQDLLKSVLRRLGVV